MERRQLSYSCVLICLLCLFGIAACSDEHDSEGIVGTWISRGLRSDVRATFDNDGRFIIVRIKNGSISSKGDLSSEGKSFTLIRSRGPRSNL